MSASLVAHRVMMTGRRPFLLKIAPHSPNILRQQSHPL
jgi:hypothetical protein